MRLSELFEGAWAVLPLASGDLAGVLQEILGHAAAVGTMTDDQAAELARGLASGAHGEIARMNEDVVAVLGSLEGLERLTWTVGVAPRPFRIMLEGSPEPGSARVVILALVPGRLTGVRQDLLPVLGRALREGDSTARLLAAVTPGDVLQIPGLAGAEFHPRLRVEDALVPVAIRVHPDTPLDEVVDVMVRNKIHAVPVVGQRDEVLGILTSGDVLAYRLEGSGPGGNPRGRTDIGPRRARDHMTRTVLCVSEEQSLTEAAHMMVNRDVEQLPVVREGALVGFVTRDSLLEALHGASGHTEPEREEGPSEK